MLLVRVVKVYYLKAAYDDFSFMTPYVNKNKNKSLTTYSVSQIIHEMKQNGH